MGVFPIMSKLISLLVFSYSSLVAGIKRLNLPDLKLLLEGGKVDDVAPLHISAFSSGIGINQGKGPMYKLDFTVPLSTDFGVKTTWTKEFAGKNMPGKTKPKATKKKVEGKKPAAKAKKSKPARYAKKATVVAEAQSKSANEEMHKSVMYRTTG